MRRATRCPSRERTCAEKLLATLPLVDDGQPQGKRRSAAELAAQRNVAAQQACDAPANGEAESGAVWCAGPELRELLEQLLMLLWRNTRSGIGDAQGDPFAGVCGRARGFRLRRDGDLPLRHVLHAIGNEVVQDLAHAPGIGLDQQ